MLEFAPNWKQWQQFPFNEKRLTEILENATGTVGFAIRAQNQWVRVVAGVHAGGAPGTRQDPLPHVTLSHNRQTYHVRLSKHGGIIEITS